MATAQQAVPDSFNLYNPVYRGESFIFSLKRAHADTFSLDTYRTLPSFTGPTWAVIRYQVTYPSLTFFHCHIRQVAVAIASETHVLILCQ